MRTKLFPKIRRSNFLLEQNPRNNLYYGQFKQKLVFMPQTWLHLQQ